MAEGVSGGATEDMDALKASVRQALKAKGVLAELKARVRSSVYTAIEESDGGRALVRENARAASALEGPRGILMASLVSDYLQSFDLVFARGVFQSEDGHVPRDELAQTLGLAVDDDRPLLCHLLERGGSTTSPRNGDDGGRPALSGTPAMELSPEVRDSALLHPGNEPAAPVTPVMSSMDTGPSGGLSADVSSPTPEQPVTGTDRTTAPDPAAAPADDHDAGDGMAADSVSSLSDHTASSGDLGDKCVYVEDFVDDD